METISYLRAGASCLPFVGPLVSLYNAIEVKQELSPPSNPALAALKNAVNCLSGTSKEDLLVCKKGRLYAICGIVGDALSVAAVVGLIALGIFSIVPGITAIAAFLIQAAILGYNLYQINKTITSPQTA